MSKTIVKADGIKKAYSMNEQRTEVLKGIDLNISEGEYIAVVGPSGAGKSTLLHILAWLDEPDKGKVEYLIGEQISRNNELNSQQKAAFRNKNIGFVFQFHHLLPEFTALENVMLPALIAAKSFSVASARAGELLEIVGMTQRASHKPSELSGGEQQRVAIARAIMNEPRIVFADEPTGNLDAANSKAVLRLFKQLREMYSLTFIVATHNAEITAGADRVIRLADGKVI